MWHCIAKKICLLCRKVSLTNIQGRERGEKLYMELLVYRNVIVVYLRIIMGLWTFCNFLGIMIATFVAVKHTEMAIYIYLFFPIAAAAGALVTFLNIYKGICTVRVCSIIHGQLVSVDSVHLMSMRRREREAVMVKTRSLRPVSLPLGCFASFSVNSMWNLGKEIVNQVLLLLSL